MNDVIQFEDFSKAFGFKSYPFNSFTAENEKEKQPDLFLTTKLYSPLFEAFEAGQSMILSGDRGTGKTSITYDFMRRSKSDWLVCKIDDFSSLSIDYTEADFYRFITQDLVNNFFSNLINIKNAKKKMSDDEKILLTYYYINFASDAVRGLATRTARSIQLSWWRQCGISLYNFCRNPLNIFTSVGVNIVADVVAKSMGGSGVSDRVAEYFPEIVAGVESKLPKAEDSLEALNRFAILVQKTGFRRVILILDKIDEDPRLENAAEEISLFIESILTNNKFLLSHNFQTIVSTWIVPLNFLKGKVRTQKIQSPEIRWEHDDLRRVYDRRVMVFSENNARTFDNTFSHEVSSEMRKNILELSNGNPRDLWHLMNKIFRAQYAIDATSNSICNSAIERGMSDFVQTFNFYEYYPKKANARANSMDIYSYIKHLLKLESHKFTRNQLNDRAGTGSSTTNYTTGMESLGLIERDASEKGEATFKIRDAKVRYAISHGIDISKT